MKKRLALIVASVLLLAMTLSACSGVTSGVARILDTEFDVSSPVIQKATELEELKGYKVLFHNDYFAVFNTLVEPDAGGLTYNSYKILSMRTGAVLATFGKQFTGYDIEFFYDVPAFRVAETEFGTNEYSSYSLYDETGACVVTTAYDAGEPVRFAYNVIIYDGVAYREESDGSLKKLANIPEYLELAGEPQFVTEEHYYYINGLTVDVYDRSFKHVRSWQAPSFAADDIGGIFVLDNGHMLAQYAYTVDEDSEKYNISVCLDNGTTVKKRLVSVIVDPESGKEKKINLNCVISNLYTNTTLRGSGGYTDDFDNIAFVYPLVDAQVDLSPYSLDIVLLNNSGSIGESVKFVDGQTSLPRKLDKDVYEVTTAMGKAYINVDGELLYSFNSPMRVVGSYFVGERYIYDLDLNEVYDLVERNATVLETVNDTVYVKSVTKTGYEIHALCGGVTSLIYSFKNDGTTVEAYHLYTDIGHLILTDDGEYRYYNTNGELILTTNGIINIQCQSNKYKTYIITTVDQGTLTYHFFTE